jgi:hypothetical protein
MNTEVQKSPPLLRAPRAACEHNICMIIRGFMTHIVIYNTEIVQRNRKHCFHPDKNPRISVRVIRRRRTIVRPVFCSHDIDATRAKCFAVLLGSPADGGQMFLVTHCSFVHMTSAPAMIDHTRKMFRGFVGITRRRRTIVQNIKHVWSDKTLFRNKGFWFFFIRRRWIFVRKQSLWIFYPKINVFGQKSIVSARLNICVTCARFTPDAQGCASHPRIVLRAPAARWARNKGC